MAVEGLVRGPRAGGTVWGMAPWLFAFANDLRLALRRNRVVRQFRPRAYAAVVGAVALTMLAAACSSSSTSGNGSGSTGQQGQLKAGFQGLNPGTGAPQRGGTLNMVGISDVDYLDYDTGYYTTDYQVARLTESHRPFRGNEVLRDGVFNRLGRRRKAHGGQARSSDAERRCRCRGYA